MNRSPNDLQLPALGPVVRRLSVFAEAFEGLGDVRGFLLFDGRQLRFDFQTVDAIFGVIKSNMRQLQIPLGAIEKVRRGPGWFWLRPYIELELNDFALLNTVPGTHHGSWRLRVRFADRHELRRFADALTFARSGHLHESLERSLDTTQLSEQQERQPERIEPQAPPPQRRTGVE